MGKMKLMIRDELSPEQARLRDLIRSHENEARRLKQECTHVLRAFTEEERKDPCSVGFSKCLICGARFGWRCVHSPDSVCHYSVEVRNGYVTLIDGTPYKLKKKDHDLVKKLRWSEGCIFCLQPETRK